MEHPVRCKMGEWEGGIAYLNGGLVSGIEISKWSKIYRVLENKSLTQQVVTDQSSHGKINFK